jgi:hypothetical protein
MTDGCDDGIPDDLSHWLALADEVARRHRQGYVLGLDPVLVLRGLPPVWRRVTGQAAPADDVVALAGAALSLLRDAEDPIRPPLVEAAAGCLGSDLPTLLRRIRPDLSQRRAPEDGSRTTADAGGPSGAGADGAAGSAATGGAATGGPSPRPGRFRLPFPAALARRGHHRPVGTRLAVAGALGAVALALVGVAGLRWGGAGGAPVALGPAPVALAGDPPAVLRWDAPHLVVDVGPVRHRYRFDRTVDAVALRADPRHPTLVVAAGGRRWEVSVPALDGLSGTAGPR